MPTRDVTIYYLEMTERLQLKPKWSTTPEVGVAKVVKPMPTLNRFFYTAVGADWFWVDRLSWNLAAWRKFLDRPEVETWILSVAGVPAGYYELEWQPGNDVEIAYFGLLPEFAGQGLGAHLLTHAIERGWNWGAKRVWVHTCSLDHPHALAHYEARGLKQYQQETISQQLPETTPGPWPGSV